MLDPLIVNCLKLIQQTDIYKAESAKFKKQLLEYRKALKKTKANKCKYYNYDSFYSLAENKCCNISDYPKCCRLLLDEECGAFTKRSWYVSKKRSENRLRRR